MNSNLARFRQKLQDGNFPRIGANDAVVLVCRSQPESDQAAHHAKGWLLQD